MKNLAIAALLAVGLLLAPTHVSADQVAASTSTPTLTFDGYYGPSGGGLYWSIAGGGNTSCDFQALTGDAYLVFAQSSTQKYEFFVPRGTTSYSGYVPHSHHVPSCASVMGSSAARGRRRGSSPLALAPDPGRAEASSIGRAHP